MSTGRLSTTSYVALGMIGLRGPSTPYDLKRGIGRSVGYFWPFPHAQLYAEPERLERMGLLAVQPEDSGRRRKTYSLTESGRNALREWLAAPTNEHFQMRDIAELKLFFNELGDPGNVAGWPGNRSASISSGSPCTRKCRRASVSCPRSRGGW